MKKICIYITLFILYLTSNTIAAKLTIDPGAFQPCKKNIHCSVIQYCAKQPGQCNGNGICMIKPDACTLQYNPVCGCDGKTYGNACEAASAGVNIQHEGECTVISSCESNTECNNPDQFCAKANGHCSGKGICQSKPQACPDVWDPVCGCDGITYSNSCDANANGANIAYQGECKLTDLCISNNDCPVGSQYCDKPKGVCNGVGSCHIRPDICSSLYDPVCGCDGNTYDNSCVAASAGSSISYDGPCSPRVIQ